MAISDDQFLQGVDNNLKETIKYGYDQKDLKFAFRGNTSVNIGYSLYDPDGNNKRKKKEGYTSCAGRDLTNDDEIIEIYHNSITGGFIYITEKNKFVHESGTGITETNFTNFQAVLKPEQNNYIYYATSENINNNNRYNETYYKIYGGDPIKPSQIQSKIIGYKKNSNNIRPKGQDAIKPTKSYYKLSAVKNGKSDDCYHFEMLVEQKVKKGIFGEEKENKFVPEIYLNCNRDNIKNIKLTYDGINYGKGEIKETPDHEKEINKEFLPGDEIFKVEFELKQTAYYADGQFEQHDYKTETKAKFSNDYVPNEIEYKIQAKPTKKIRTTIDGKQIEFNQELVVGYNQKKLSNIKCKIYGQTQEKTALEILRENLAGLEDSTTDKSWHITKNRVLCKDFDDNDAIKVETGSTGLTKENKWNESVEIVYDNLLSIAKKHSNKKNNIFNFLGTIFSSMTINTFTAFVVEYINNKELDFLTKLDKKVDSIEENGSISKNDIKELLSNKTAKDLIDGDLYNTDYYNGDLYNSSNGYDYAKEEKWIYRCIADRKVKLYTLGGCKIGENGGFYGYSTVNGIFAILIKSNDKTNYTAEDEIPDSYSGIDAKESFIEKWRAELKKDEKETQSYINIDNYYDFYSGMTPYIIAGFCTNKVYDEENKKYNYIYNYIDTINHPFIKNLTIKDNGVKKITLQLLDPNFGSYSTIRYLDREGKQVKKDGKPLTVPSLDYLIKKALAPKDDIKKAEQTNIALTTEEGEVGQSYLEFKETVDSNPTNLRIRFGYADYNMTFEAIKDANGKYIDKNGNPTTNKKEAVTNANDYGFSNQRDARWWDAKNVGASGDVGVEKLSHFIKEGEIKEGGSVDISGDVTNSVGTNISINKLINSPQPTTSKSRMFDFMITKLNTKVTNKGLEYTIEAIETKHTQLLTTRFLQRYAEITSYPEDVLYCLMHMFNEDNEGNNITSSNIKIYLADDPNDPENANILLNQEYDNKLIKEEDAKNITAMDTYNSFINNHSHIIQEDKLKKITVSLGGEDAVRNYSTQLHYPLYKSVSSLLTEFCSQCPPKKVIKYEDEKVDPDGNTIISNSEIKNIRPLKWMCFKGNEIANNSDEDTIYVVLYYRTTRKPKIIRIYDYGVYNPYKTCITNLDISTANEFAVLNGIKAFDGKARRYEQQNLEGKKYVVNRHNLKEKDIIPTNIAAVGSVSQNYMNAYSSALYKGNMEILGDPFYSFDGIMQPMTYPILLNVLLPISQEYLNSNGNTGDFEKYNTKLRANSNGNIALHESSGFYVISEIEHKITPNKFTTTLELYSYPNIQKDVLMEEQSSSTATTATNTTAEQK